MKFQYSAQHCFTDTVEIIWEDSHHPESGANWPTDQVRVGDQERSQEPSHNHKFKNQQTIKIGN